MVLKYSAKGSAPQHMAGTHHKGRQLSCLPFLGAKVQVFVWGVEMWTCVLRWDPSSEPFRRWSELPLTLIVVKAVIEGLHQEILDFEHYTSVCSKTGQGGLSESGH